MPALTSIPFPDANATVKALLADLAPTRLSVPQDFQPPLIVVKRIGGQPDVEDVTDFPIMLVAVYGASYPAAQALMGQVQTRILSAPATLVSILDDNGDVTGTVLVDSTGIHVGEAEVPDVYPDDRRITSTYQFGWRRQFPIG
jgi:hypothetical protein